MAVSRSRDRDIARHPQRESASRKRKRVPDFIDVRVRRRLRRGDLLGTDRYEDTFVYVRNIETTGVVGGTSVMRFVCERRALAEKRERRANTQSSFELERAGSRVSGLSDLSAARKRSGRIWSVYGKGDGGRKEGRVHQICEEYTRRSQSFAVRLRETTIYSRGKSHTHSWISAKRLYYRQYCAGCVALGVARSTFPGFAFAIAPTDLGSVILFAQGSGRQRLREEIKYAGVRGRLASLGALQHAACGFDAFRGLRAQ